MDQENHNIEPENHNIELEKHNIKTKKDNVKLKNHDKSILFLILGIIFILGGIGCILFEILKPKEEISDLVFPQIPSTKSDNSEKTYSKLTGEELAMSSLVNSPAFCVQTPNDTYGARPQTGLTDAGVVFEAIAEGGITRFAAIYQNPTKSILGPVRSLRLYYLDWDMAFDCTIVHAGGSAEALQAVRERGTKDLTENYNYMYRGNYAYHSYDNLFMTPDSLAKFSKDSGYTTSEIKGFTRQLPEEAEINRVDSMAEKLDITKATSENTSKLSPKVTKVNINFGNNDQYNIAYTYNVNTNSYDRAYVYGGAHEVYDCVENADLFGKDPVDACNKKQLSPKVVIGMIVDEKRHSDGKHEVITTVGTNTAYIFQNGEVIKGRWKKTSVTEQIKFYTDSGEEIKLIPGQTWISAVPTAYGGSVKYK